MEYDTKKFAELLYQKLLVGASIMNEVKEGGPWQYDEVQAVMLERANNIAQALVEILEQCEQLAKLNDRVDDPNFHNKEIYR